MLLVVDKTMFFRTPSLFMNSVSSNRLRLFSNSVHRNTKFAHYNNSASPLSSRKLSSSLLGMNGIPQTHKMDIFSLVNNKNPAFSRAFSNGSRAKRDSKAHKERNTSVLLYMLSIVTVGVGLSYAAVPLYKVFCQVTGFGGTTQQATLEQAKKMIPVPGSKPITIEFTSTTSDTLPWKFVPQQRKVTVVPGETALAFYTATNKSDKAITGVATYNITPPKAGLYFNKIQCFCFDQQRLRPNEEVDMPVFFYIDPTFADDPQMVGIENIILSYTFFQAKN